MLYLWKKMEVYRMDSFFSSSTLFNIVLAVIWFVNGIRDFQGKDPLIKLPFDQYVRDPEYRAFWQKKNGVFYMVKHVILWQLKDELSDTEKAAVKAGIKEGLEGLAGQIPGLVDIRVNIDALPSSNADLMLDTTFETAEALKGYSTHPAHVAVANSKVRPYYKNRVCLDYEV